MKEIWLLIARLSHEKINRHLREFMLSQPPKLGDETLGRWWLLRPTVAADLQFLVLIIDSSRWFMIMINACGVRISHKFFGSDHVILQAQQLWSLIRAADSCPTLELVCEMMSTGRLPNTSFIHHILCGSSVAVNQVWLLRWNYQHGLEMNARTDDRATCMHGGGAFTVALAICMSNHIIAGAELEKPSD